VPSTPTASDQIVIVGARDIERTTDFVTAGDLRASALNEQLDGLTIFDQQIAEEQKRTLQAPVYDPAHVDDGGTLDMTLPAKAARAGKYLQFNSTTGNPEAGPDSADVTALADVATDIATLADIQDGTTATNAITTVSSISGNVTTVAGVAANVSTVAGISSDVTAVAADATDIGIVATNITGVNSFAERYRVGATDPTTSLDEGDLFFNTTDNAYKFYDGSAWQSVNVTGIGSVVDDSTPQLGGNLDTNGNDINFGDNDKVTFGAGSDLQIYHDGSNSFISDQGTGNLRILAEDFRVVNSTNSETMIQANVDSDVRLYYDSAVKLSTTASGIDVQGSMTVDTDTLYVDSTNNRIGIGTISPSANLEIDAGSATGTHLQITTTGSGHNFDMIDSGGTARIRNAGGVLRIDADFNNETADSRIQFDVDGTERMRIDSSGRVGIGIDSPSAALDVNGTIEVTDDGGGGQINNVFTNSGTAGNDNVTLRVKIGGSTARSMIQFADTDDTNVGQIDYDHDDDAMKFTVNASEEMIIKDGDILIGTSSLPNGTSSYGSAFQDASNDRKILRLATSALSANLAQFYNPNGQVGSISVSSSTTSYNTSSDYRLKENVVADWDATTRLKQLNPVRFNFTASPDTTVDGFLAHEVQGVVPEAITGTHNEVDDEGNPVYQGIDQSKLVPLLVKTIQELEARIAALENA
jgi:hypothetical protein